MILHKQEDCHCTKIVILDFARKLFLSYFKEVRHRARWRKRENVCVCVCARGKERERGRARETWRDKQSRVGDGGIQSE